MCTPQKAQGTPPLQRQYRLQGRFFALLDLPQLLIYLVTLLQRRSTDYESVSHIPLGMYRSVGLNCYRRLGIP
jgi:hypothetical protein